MGHWWNWRNDNVPASDEEKRLLRNAKQEYAVLPSYQRDRVDHLLSSWQASHGGYVGARRMRRAIKNAKRNLP